MHRNTASLPLMLKQLRLATVGTLWESVADKATKEQWSPQQYLAELCHQELLAREDKRLARNLKDATLPIGKHLNNFDFMAVDGINQATTYDLLQDKTWLTRGANLLLFGASGLGKTHLASALGYGLLEQGYKVKFIQATTLVQQLQLAKRHLKLQDELKKLDKYQLLIIDDVGYVRKSEQETSVLFELIAHRYERFSLAITSNKSFEEWDELLDDTTMTVAAIDRLVHHATMIHFTGESYRKKEALKTQDKGQ